MEPEQVPSDNASLMMNERDSQLVLDVVNVSQHGHAFNIM